VGTYISIIQLFKQFFSHLVSTLFNKLYLNAQSSVFDFSMQIVINKCFLRTLKKIGTDPVGLVVFKKNAKTA